MNENAFRLEQERVRREMLMWRTLDNLRRTVQLQALRPDAPVTDVRVEMTDASAQILAPLIEAVDILEAIIFASDGCVGHRDCMHSMEPWQRARALLSGKWKAESESLPWMQGGLADPSPAGER